MVNVKVKKLVDDAVIPTYQTTGAACFDISTTSENSVLPAGEQLKLDTGLSFEIPEAHVMLVFSRSGFGFSKRTRLSNCVGVIDSDYRGELKVALHNDGKELLEISKGDRIAQGMVLPVEQVTFELVEELNSTSRGEGGLGSTGVTG